MTRPNSGATIIRVLIILLSILALALWAKARMGTEPQNTNEFFLTGKAESHPLFPPFEIDGISRADLMVIRRDKIAPYIGRYLKEYKPSVQVFGQVEDGAPWWGLEGIYRFGPGSQSIEGLSEETRAIGNPLLLVSIIESRCFYHNYPKGAVPWPQPISLDTDPEHNEMRATFKVGGYIKHLKSHRVDRPGLTLVAYNARDLGFVSLEVGGDGLEGVSAVTGRPIPLTQYIHRGGSCGYPNGCNNMSPYVSELEVTLNSLPSTIPITLNPAQENSKKLKFRIELIY